MHSAVVNRLESDQFAALEALSDGDFYACPGWLRYEAVDADSEQWFALVYEHDELVAGVPMYLVSREANRRYDSGQLTGQCSPQRALIVGGRRGYAGQICAVHDERRTAALSLLASTVDAFAKECAGGISWWMFLRERDVLGLSHVVETAGPWLVAAEAVIPLPGQGFDDYLSSLPRKRRATVRNDRQRYAGAGLTTTTHTLHEAWRDLTPLVGAHQRRNGHPQSDEALGQMLRQQAVPTIGQSLVCLGRNPDPVAAGLYFSARKHVTSRAFGTLLPKDARIGEYFELAYYRPIEHAYDLGLKELHLGIGTLRPKILRGAEIQLRWTVAIGLNNDRVDPRPHNERESHAIATEIGDFTGVLSEDSRLWIERNALQEVMTP